MATARRRYADDAPHLMMPNGFKITVGGVAAFIALMSAVYGFYNSTQSTLTTHGTQIEKLSAKGDAIQKEINDNDKNTQAKLSDLHEQSTVANNNQKTMGDQLDKIVQQLNTLSLASAPRR